MTTTPAPDLRLADLAEFIDLDAAPYSTRFSRLLVLSADGMSTWAGRARTASGTDTSRAAGPQGEAAAGARSDTHRSTGLLSVLRAAYERSAADSVVLDDLRLQRGGVPETWEAGADGIRFAGGARLLVTAEDRIVLTGLRAGDELTTRWTLPTEETDAWPGRVSLRETLHVTGRAEVLADGDQVQIRAHGAVELVWSVLPVPAALDAAALVTEHDRTLAAWMARCPRVAPPRQAMTALCWWVLGNNTLHLRGETSQEAVVVPSKLGYVGLWQWDAYFIALGLRHGAPELAAAQMEVALGHARADGQLPDVVHDHGVLDSSESLPPGDVENLRRLGSPTLEGQEVPLTKPPLTALTLELLSTELGPAVIDRHLEAVLAAQRWWFRRSDPGETGWPAYLHPYSSGLDDSPVFDHNAILRSPDLAAYLVGQDQLLAAWLAERGREDEAAQCRARGERLRELLEASWDGERELFVVPGERSEVTTRTVLNLLALLIPGLRPSIRDSLIAQVTDPARFGGRWPLPTVSRDDPDFSPERMWRGPIWVNTAWLVRQGLLTQGEDELAESVRTAVLDLVQHAGGPSEYFNPDTGRKADRATVLFGWSSALFVDLAVQEAAEVR
ncbi:hypothetical protein [Brachybacterium sp. YJGR34]|uniref:MGH1-like glycoside hydrolase domain-containing protein n=1 Tax=Brachybacterium sp. YJGR34 TaxID=2059911 RepID=UPI000E0C9748|nr:hypothetical protein [Brachybacterium sp. YJGR34]